MTAEALVDALLARLSEHWRWWPEAEIRALPEFAAINDAPDDVRRACTLRLAAIGADHDAPGTSMAHRVLGIMLRRRTPLSERDVAFLLAVVRDNAAHEHGPWWAGRLLQVVAKTIETTVARWPEGDREQLAPLLRETIEAVEIEHPTATRLRALLPAGLDLADIIPGGDDVGPRLRAVLAAADESSGAVAALLDVLVAYPETGRPSARWLTQAEEVRAALRDPHALTAALLDALLAAGDTEFVYSNGHRQVGFVRKANERLAAGIALLSTDLDRLRRLAAKAVVTVGGQFGSPRSLRLANACARRIAETGGPAAITELLALERTVRHGLLLLEIRKAIDTLAAAEGVTRDELLERAVETHGLDADGRREVPLSRGSAVVAVAGRSVTLGYRDETGTPKRSFPAAVKDELAPLRADVKAIRKTIAGERARLDGLLALDRVWTADEWRRLYLDHPVTGRLARTAIWRFGDVVAMPDGEIPDGEVRLWHPIHSTADEVHAWRMRLLEGLVVQPIKQAFRELYVITPAEEQSSTYSNRFAGHVFRQVQARALMKRRGWQAKALAWWDDGVDHGVAKRVFAAHGIEAHFLYDPIHDVEPSGDLYPYCTSDQVRFYAGAERVALPDVPPLVFSEAMRDVDLFIGVTSIGADPEWLDRGDDPRFEAYWHDFGFGALGEAAKVRRDVLAELLPQLAIADRCELSERYLTVRGDLRTYRIHLGSGNILMEPDDRYLCIVAARDRRADLVFLPFDDDQVLSLVLSKAFLLADDTAIDDPTIVEQIRS